MPGQGLLQKANLLHNSERLAFFDFTAKHKIKYCGLLKNISNKYVLTISKGLDSESIMHSISTPDFWNGTVSEINKIYSYSRTDNSINTFMQFFSQKLRDEFVSLNVIRFPDNSIFYIINQQLNKNIIEDFQNIDFTKNVKTTHDDSYCKYKLIFEEIQLPQTENINDNLIVNTLKNTILNEISNVMFSSFQEYSSVEKIDSYKYKIFIKQNRNLPDELLKFHLVSILKDTTPFSIEQISLTKE